MSGVPICLYIYVLIMVAVSVCVSALVDIVIENSSYSKIVNS